MEQIVIDCAALKDAAALHKALAEALEFPDWYGSNLDALYDCLTDLESLQLQLQNLGPWAEGFREVFRDVMEENPDIKITF